MRIYQNYHKHDFGSNVRVPDCVCSQEDYAKRAVEFGHSIISSVAHGWQNRYIDTYELAKKYNLKFVFGTEAYWVKDRHIEDKTNCHIVLLARNENGRRAINHILSIANEDGFYYQPRIDVELINTLPPNDVIVTTACVAFFRYGFEYADKLIIDLANHFKKNFFLEVQPHHTPKQCEINKHIIQLSNAHNIKIIAGCDSHYIKEEDAWEREEYLASKGIKYEDEEGWFLDYPDGDTLFQRFKEQGVLTNAQIEEAMNNTNVCLEVEEYDCECFKTNIKMPTLYPELTQEERNQKFENLVYSLWDNEKININKDQIELYEDEIKKELSTVIDTNHADYFLLNYNLINNGKKIGGILTNSSRGSGGSFYINKLLGFTTIDRISAQVKMFPERFMSKTRILETKSLADIDFNCSNPDVFAQAQEDLLGYEHAKPMIAYGTFKPKNAWRMYARAKQVDNDTAVAVSQQIDEYNKALAFAEEDSKEEININDFIDPQYLELFEDSKSYLGIYSDLKMSPCSYLLYNGNIKDEIGFIRTKSQSGESHLCCVMDKVWADKYKFLKNDLLKVKSVDLINRVFDRVGIPVFDSTTLINKCTPDNKVWDVYKNAWTIGINQVEQPKTAHKVAMYKPKNISELCAFVAAVRPGFKSMYDVFESREPFSYNIPSFDNLIRTPQMPNSFVLYQETTMQTLNYAGIPMDETYGIVKAISKKNANLIKSYKNRFIEGFMKKTIDSDGIDEDAALESARKVWQILEDSSSYNFNSSHSYAMAIDSLYLAWLKSNYPLEFYEVFLKMCEDDGEKDRMVLAKQEAELAFKINFPPYKFGQDNRNINLDKKTNSIMMSLKSIKRFNQSMADTLYEASKEFFPTFTDLLYYLLINGVSMPRVLDLIHIQYFSDFGASNKLSEIYAKFTNGEFKISKTLKENTINKRLDVIREFESNLPEKELPFKDQIQYSQDILGYIQPTFNFISNRYAYILDIDTTHSPRVEAYFLKSGKTMTLKIGKKQFNNAKFTRNTILFVDGITKRPKSLFVNGEFIPSPTETELWITSYIKVDNFDEIINNSNIY